MTRKITLNYFIDQIIFTVVIFHWFDNRNKHRPKNNNNKSTKYVE